MPKGAIHYTGTNFARLRRLDVVSRVRTLTDQRMMQRPQWLPYAERAPPMELSNLHLRCRKVPNTYLTLTRELLQKYPDIRFQDCFVEGNETAKGKDTYRADHPAMQFVALQLRLMNQGLTKTAAFKKAEGFFLERRAALERSQKLHMAAAIAAAAAADPAAAGRAPMAAAAAPLDIADGMGLVQPMFTSGRAYWQMKVAESRTRHLLHIRRVLRRLRERAEPLRQELPTAASRRAFLPSLRHRAFGRSQQPSRTSPGLLRDSLFPSRRSATNNEIPPFGSNGNDDPWS